jgi:hypothetical protein
MDTLVSPSIAQPDFAASPLLADMLEDMADAIPVRETDTPERIARRHQAARAMVMSLHPADAIEAAMAISATVADSCRPSAHHTAGGCRHRSHGHGIAAGLQCRCSRSS